MLIFKPAFQRNAPVLKVVPVNCILDMCKYDEYINILYDLAFSKTNQNRAYTMINTMKACF